MIFDVEEANNPVKVCSGYLGIVFILCGPLRYLVLTQRTQRYAEGRRVKLRRQCAAWVR